jgi:hypothetical protein
MTSGFALLVCAPLVAEAQWRSPLEVYTLCFTSSRVSISRQESTDGEMYRVGRASCTVGVLSQSGKRVGTHVVETSARSLMALLDTIPGRKHVCLEEGTMAGWLYEVLSPHVEEVAVAGVEVAASLQRLQVAATCRNGSRG